VRAARAFVAEVQSGAFPGAEHSFGMSKPKSVGERTGQTPLVEEPPPAYGPASDDA
jgi:hypothetical protein